ncbi:MAG: 3-oxoacyl-ACP reductase [Deltaproteobacteria bacterium CG_4_10_14_3_um_filter_60_8]|nr:MAG: 3-oxoacyl-ACP reductase [Desulfobacterales bacterium CG2_30_60_27]PIP44447.1 MAG: 3-oxoacyl-ACP reductase [Deltaproteobacteria bacterium CG23_combo_of_CG06-09_8_20_14_all_60_8]PIY22732.1 MAG: 3-oxoacyl-ACP reductase [Deltaproteobacteria bacterium CG_4_10_14_3_um_filter_60_8]
MDLQGKTALILGGAKGIGKAIGFALARQGVTVILTCHDWPEAVAEMQGELAALPGKHLAVSIDLRDPAQIKNLLQRIREQFGCLHILVNNIERGGMPVVHGPYTSEQWDLELETTLKAKWFVFHHALPLLKAAGQAAVVNLSSIAGIVGRSGPAGLIFNDGYAAANRGVSSFTETWAREGAPEVRVNELMLGFCETRHAEKTRGWELLTTAQREAILAHIPLGRAGRLEDVVQAIMFLIREADYMTGAVLRLDGGYCLGHSEVPLMPAGVL